MTAQNPFPQPTRQASVAILFILGNVLRLLVRQLWVVIIVLVLNPKRQVFSNFTLFIIAMAAFGAGISVLNYFRHFFYISEDELVMEKGVFRKTKVNVPLDRIQTVNFKQGILHRFFNVVAVDIDTAGSVGSEFSLQALSRGQAEALRAYLENARDQALTSTVSPESGEGTTLQPARAAAGNGRLLFSLTLSDLLKIGVSQNHLRTAGIIMAFFLGFADDVEQALNIDFTERLGNFLGSAQGAQLFSYLLVGIPFLLVVSFLITLVRTSLQYFELRFWRTERGFKIVSGLFTRQEVSANLQKIQFVRWDSSPLMRLFGMVSVQMPQAASVELSRKMAVGLPGCYQAQLDAVREAYFPKEKQLETKEHGVDGRMARRQFLLKGILPVALLMLVTRSLLGSSIWIWPLWLPFALWLSVKYCRTWRWHVSEEGILAERGVINRTTTLLQWYKVQAVTVRQSIFLRRLGLAHITLYTAAGAVNIPYIPIEKANALRDFVLFKIETDGRPWM